ncbi:V-type proton ATPase subunit F [Drosophila subpulchrella]|uniref:V-type proton ATPase subunit F n=1 Tax=Drosophila subpulchrella TaxID=1486046 RepID=UPI0018A17390|nr:V-type proton ATPase subunit F [Drosophila subpulchrella]
MASSRKRSLQKQEERMSEEGDKSGSDSDMSDVDMQAYTFVDDPNVLRIAIMADPEVTLGFLLAGIGYQKDRFRNYMMVESETLQEDLEQFFLSIYRRSNIGIIILDYNTAKRLRALIQRCHQLLPVLVTVPNKSSLTTYLDKKDRNRRLRQRDAY